MALQQPCFPSLHSRTLGGARVRVGCSGGAAIHGVSRKSPRISRILGARERNGAEQKQA